MNDSIYVGFVTKSEILKYLDIYGIKTKENLEPLQDLRDNQCLKLDLIEYYTDLFDRCEKESETTIIDDKNDSLQYDSSDNECSETFNDTLAEMEAFLTKGADYDFEESFPSKSNRESSFCPPISSTNALTNDNSIKSDISNHETNSLQSDLGYFASHSNSPTLKNASNFFKNISNLSESPKLPEFKLEKLNLNSPEKTPSKLIRINKIAEATTSKNKTPISTKENINVFKTPLPKTKTQNFRNIVSPISRYISETPTVPLIQKVVHKTVPFSEHNFKAPNKTSKYFAELPQVSYRPSKMQQITIENRSSPLPKCLDKYVSKPLRPEIIKHNGRVNVKNEYEEFYESYPIDLRVEDLSSFIDLETSRITEMSVIVSSEAKFSSELRK